ncbi:EAL domain-containing protein [Rhizobium sp. C4]|uniref:EAL domain-containing protein n=1 Tax=Rhizobium sp. C4 TaxID=1349800 RepID=UPI001E5D3E11|nr:EAL domain-containing protein [Rhizobium sp. C4]MCD2174452.1 EAL domain-containing protein [Rhizobium sp. C4]
MDTVSRLTEAARYLDGMIFVLRRECEDGYVLEEAHGAIGPLTFDDPVSLQATYEAAIASMPAQRRLVFMSKLRDIFECRGPVNEFLEMVLGDVVLNIEMRGEVAEGAAGLYLAGFVRDCAEAERLGAQRKAEAVLSATVRLFPDMVWLKDEEGRYVLCNEMFDRFNSVPSAELIGKTARETEQGRTDSVHDRTDMLALGSSEIVTFETNVTGRDGSPRSFDVRKLALRDDEGNPIAILGTARETTEWRRLVNELRQGELAYRSLADNIPDRLIRFGPGGQYLHTNRSMREFFETIEFFTPEQIGDRDPRTVRNGVASLEIQGAVTEVFAKAKAVTREVALDGREGQPLVHEIRFFPEFGPDGAVDSVLAIGRDVTERKEMEKRLARSEAELHALAFRDSLTGLHNRRAFQDLLQQVLEAAKKSKLQCALLLLDIDRFKLVNDTLGHAVGDELIIQFALRLVGAVGDEGYVCRLGGDEFAIIMPVLADQSEADDLARRVHNVLNTPVSVSVDSISITTSIGIAFGLGDTSDQNELFRFADMALYAAKSGGRARTTIYNSSMAAQAERRFELEVQIGEGLRNDEFHAHFQAKVDLETGAINGVEALCRWLRPGGLFISPFEFIPMAEETGQIIEIGRRVLLEACRFAVRVNAGRSQPIPVSVNVSPRQLLFGGFIGALGTCLEETGCDSRWLELEITESLLLGDDSTISETLDAIVGLGVSLTIDDFGTGFSSLSYLARFPITTLKIDRTFVHDLETNDKNAVLCRAIISMAQGLGLKTVAEGIETAEIAARLRRLGCQTGQGYLWSRPQPAETMLAVIRSQHAQHEPAAIAG